MLNKEIQSEIIGIIEKTLSMQGIEADHYYFKEGDFADQIGVSRSTVREAISSLEVRGYVKRYHGKGVKAVDKSVEAVSNSISDLLMRSDFEYADVFEFRNILEVKGAGIAAQHRTDEHIRNMQRQIEIMNSPVAYKVYLNADLLFHEEVIKATQNKLLTALIGSYTEVIRYAIEISTDENLSSEHLGVYHRA